MSIPAESIQWFVLGLLLLGVAKILKARKPIPSEIVGYDGDD